MDSGAWLPLKTPSLPSSAPTCIIAGPNEGTAAHRAGCLASGPPASPALPSAAAQPGFVPGVRPSPSAAAGSAVAAVPLLGVESGLGCGSLLATEQ